MLFLSHLQVISSTDHIKYWRETFQPIRVWTVFKIRLFSRLDTQTIQPADVLITWENTLNALQSNDFQGFSVECWLRSPDVNLKNHLLTRWNVRLICVFVVFVLCSGSQQRQHGSVCEEQISVRASTQPPAALSGEDDGEDSDGSEVYICFYIFRH